MLPDGTLLIENTAILMWVQTQSQNPDFHRAPDSPDYFQILRWTSFVSSEIHKGLFRVVFYDEATDDCKERFLETGMKRLAVLNDHLSDQEFLVGNHFSAADAYLSWALNLAPRAGINFDKLIHLCRYRDDMLSRPAIAKVLAADQAS